MSFRTQPILIVLWAVATATPAAAARLDPFQPVAITTRAHNRSPTLNPFRTPAPQTVSPRTAQIEPGGDDAEDDGVPPAPAAAPAAPDTPLLCQDDHQCPDGSICTDGLCQVIERPLHVLLFRKDGPKTAFMPFYWARTGVPGHRVIAPFYFHFWSHSERVQVVAPFYWRFEDHIQHRVVGVVFAGLPISWTRDPESRSWAVWPLVYSSDKFGWAAPLLGSFALKNPEQQKSRGLITFLYYWSRDDRTGRKLDTLIPIFYARRSPQKAFTWALPLNFYWRQKRDAKLVAFPLFYWRGHDRGNTFVTWAGYRSSEGRVTKGSLLWLYWYGRNGRTESQYDVLFPLVWSFRGPNRETTIAGPYLSLQRPNWKFRSLLPLYYAGKNPENKSAWSLFLPFYLQRQNEGGDQTSWLTLLGGGSRDRQAGTRNLTLWLPPVISRRSPNHDFDMVLGLYWRSRDHRLRSETMVLLPFIRHVDRQGSTTTIFPVFWHFRDSQARTTATALVPFYFRRNNPEDRLTAAGVFPLMGYYRDRGADGGSAGLFPLAFFGRHQDRRHAVLFPLLFHFSNPRSTTTVALPLYYRHADRHEKHSGILPLLYFRGHSRTDSYTIQFPFYWRFSDHQTGVTTKMVPPLWYTTRPDGWSGGLAPLLFTGRTRDRGHFVLFPLFWRFRDDAQDRTTTVIGPYLHRRHGDRTVDALFPLFHYGRGAAPGQAENTSFTLFPLTHYRRDAERTLFLSPLAAWTRSPQRRAGFVLPYFWYEDAHTSARGVPPLWFDVTEKQTARRTRIFGPFVAVDSEKETARILLPIFGRYWDQQETGTWVFPTYFRRRTHDGYALDTLFPLFWSSHSPGHRTLQLGPWWDRKTDTGRSTALIPLYLYTRNQERSLFLTPLSYYRNNYRDNTQSLFAALLVYHNARPTGHRTVVFPLWWSGRHEQHAHRVLFPLAWHWSDSRENSATTIIGPVFWRRHASAYSRGIAPLAWYSRNPETGASTNTLMPLFYHSAARDRRALFTPLFGFGNSVQASWWYVPPLVVHDGVKSRFNMLFPLWVSHTNKTTETNTRFFLPLLHFKRGNPERSLQSWLGLLWRHQNIASSTTVFFPLFFDYHSFYESRTTALFPLFVRHHRHSDQTAYTIAPLFFRRSHPDSSTTVLFPLLWDFKNVERRTTMFLPLFVHLQRPQWKGTYVFPNIWYRSGRAEAEGTSRFMIFPLWESEVKRRGDYAWEVLLGLFGYERVGRSRFVKVFFFPIELDPLPRAQTAWYGHRPQGTQRPTRGHGFTGHVW